MNANLAPFEMRFAPSVRQWAAESSPFAPWTSPPSDASFQAAMVDPNVTPFVLIELEQPLAYGEIWSESAPDEIELARIIVAPHARRRGLASALLRGLIAIARKTFDAPIWVRVMPDNDAAIACYARLGFVRASLEEEQRFDQEGQSPGLKWLRLAP
jgi:ribosomal protein S18 acetylase RimI-like enzyme